MAKRFLIEAEQRQRVRAGALELEAELLARAADPDDPDPDDTAKQLVDVKSTLSRVGREGLYSESVEIRREAERKEARA